MKISIAIPIYNEAQHVDEVIRRVLAVPLPPDVQKEVIVVDDGSTDGTAANLEKLKGSINFYHLTHDENLGKGAAVRTAIEKASGDILVIQDCDLEYDVNDYPRLLAPFLEESADVVYGSRFLGRIENMRFRFRLANYLLRWTANILYGAHITDEATAYKLFRMEVLKSLNLRSNRFDICPELTAKVLKRGYRIREVPINYKARTAFEGKKIGWRDAVSAFWALLRYRFTN